VLAERGIPSEPVQDVGRRVTAAPTARAGPRGWQRAVRALMGGIEERAGRAATARRAAPWGARTALSRRRVPGESVVGAARRRPPDP